MDAVARLSERVAAAEAKVTASSTAALLVRINELESALDQLQKSNRREFGKLWKLTDRNPRDVQQLELENSGDTELDAYLQLQSASTPRSR